MKTIRPLIAAALLATGAIACDDGDQTDDQPENDLVPPPVTLEGDRIDADVTLPPDETEDPGISPGTGDDGDDTGDDG